MQHETWIVFERRMTFGGQMEYTRNLMREYGTYSMLRARWKYCRLVLADVWSIEGVVCTCGALQRLLSTLR